MYPETNVLKRMESTRNFNNARRSAFWEALWSTLTGKSIDLLRFDEVKHRLHLQDERDRGLQNIEVDKIVGSVGRYRDFTRTFLPRTNAVRSRWQRLDELARGIEGFPPIQVYKVGEVYFVRDGNHRVSVARQLGAEIIEAYVTELTTRVPVDSGLTADDLLEKEAHINFLRKTNLDVVRPYTDFTLTEPTVYHNLLDHISVHRYFMGIDHNKPILWQDAVESWHDNVYLPMIELIYRHRVLEHFPGRTETDLYAWLIENQEALRLQFQSEAIENGEDEAVFMLKS